MCWFKTCLQFSFAKGKKDFLLRAVSCKELLSHCLIPTTSKRVLIVPLNWFK